MAVSACGWMQPEREIVSVFRVFMRAVELEDMRKAAAIAPFLSELTPERREAAIRSFRHLASQTLEMTVARGSGATYLLSVSSAGSSGPAALVPFRRNARGRWEMSPTLESSRHLELVSARE